jgi:hypothetical protein
MVSVDKFDDAVPDRSLLGRTQELVTRLAGLLDYESSASLAVGEIPADALRWSQRVVVQATRALTNLFYEGTHRRPPHSFSMPQLTTGCASCACVVSCVSCLNEQRMRRSCSARSSRAERSRT